jgi:hypothetical protein
MIRGMVTDGHGFEPLRFSVFLSAPVEVVTIFRQEERADAAALFSRLQNWREKVSSSMGVSRLRTSCDYVVPMSEHPARYCTGYLGDIGVPRDPAPMDLKDD